MPNQKRQRHKQSQQARRAYLAAQERRARRRRQAFAGVSLVAIMALVATSFLGGADRREPEDEPTPARPERGLAADARPDPSCPPAEGSAERRTSFPAPPPNCIEKAKVYRATVETDVGAFVVDLDYDQAPKTVSNFVFLARHRYFDGVAFHRVIPGFVVQGGDGEKGDGTGGPGYTIPDELPDSGPYPEGALAMANTGRPNSGGSQFFVVTGPQGTSLPPQYTLFGRVTEGLDVVKRIEADGTEEGTPKVLHKMLKVTVGESPAGP